MVIGCNPCGSDGRGSRFADMRGMYGKDDYEDLMSFCDAALEEYPQIDTLNLFLTGNSYGAFMANWIIGKTDRFKACVSQSLSVSQFAKFVSDIGSNDTYVQSDGSPWHGGSDNIWRITPLRYADQVKTPTLFIHTINDNFCPISESLQMFTAIREHGVKAEFLLARNKSRSLSEIGAPVQRIELLKVISSWFEGHRV